MVEKTINFESEKDIKNYFEYITKIAKEVDQWPEEKKTKRATIFYNELQETRPQSN